MSQAPTSNLTSSPRRRLVALAKLALLLVVLGFVGYSIVAQLRKVDDWSAFRPDWTLVALSGVALLGVSVVQMLGYRALLGAYGVRIGLRPMAAIAWVPPLGKYVPGKVVALVGAMAMLRRFGVPIAIAAPVVLMLDALAVLTGLIVATPILMHPAIVERFGPLVWIAVGCVIAGSVVLHPRVFVRLLNLLLTKLKRQPIPRVPTLLQYLPAIALAFAQWLFAGVALWCMTRALVPTLPIATLGPMIALAAGAMTISYLALFSPGGLGVREGIYLIALPPLLASAGLEGDRARQTVALVVVAMRLWQTFIELALAGVGAWLGRAPRPKGPISTTDEHG